MSAVDFRLAEASDSDDLARLMVGLSKHIQSVEKVEDDPTIHSTAGDGLAARLMQLGPAGENLFHSLLVFVEGQAVGCLVFSITVDAVLGEKVALVRHIFIEEAFRRHKLGTALMVQFTQLSQMEKWSRIEWIVERLDLEGRVFFDGLSPDSFRLHQLCYALDKPHMEAFVSKHADAGE